MKWIAHERASRARRLATTSVIVGLTAGGLASGVAVAGTTPTSTVLSTTASSTNPTAVGLPFFDGQTIYPTTQAGTYASEPSTSSDGSLITQITYTPDPSYTLPASLPDPQPMVPGQDADGLAFTPGVPAMTGSSSKNSDARSAAQIVCVPLVGGRSDWSSWTYTPGLDAGFCATNTDGTFHGQVPFPAVSLQWGWNFSTLVKATALTNVDEKAAAYTWPAGKKINYSDSHTGPRAKPATATFHSTITAVKANAGYQLAINFNWGCEGPQGEGKCLLYVRRYFHIHP